MLIKVISPDVSDEYICLLALAVHKLGDQLLDFFLQVICNVIHSPILNLASCLSRGSDLKSLLRLYLVENLIRTVGGTCIRHYCCDIRRAAVSLSMLMLRNPSKLNFSHKAELKLLDNIYFFYSWLRASAA